MLVRRGQGSVNDFEPVASLGAMWALFRKSNAVACPLNASERRLAEARMLAGGADGHVVHVKLPRGLFDSTFGESKPLGFIEKLDFGRDDSGTRLRYAAEVVSSNFKEVFEHVDRVLPGNPLFLGGKALKLMMPPNGMFFLQIHIAMQQVTVDEIKKELRKDSLSADERERLED